MKSKSYLLLFFLAVILTFILGVRYGQKVEKANKVINYFLNVTPTSLPLPTSRSNIGSRDPDLPDVTSGSVGTTPPKYATPSPSLKVKEDPTKSAVIFGP